MCDVILLNAQNLQEKVLFGRKLVVEYPWKKAAQRSPAIRAKFGNVLAC